MKRRAALLLALTAACGTSSTVTVDAGAPHATRPYRDLPDVPRRTVPVELPEQYALPGELARPRRARPARSGTRPNTPPPSPPAGDAVWAALARCESGMRADAVGEGVHFSYFQWKLATWRSVKADGDPDDPRDATYQAQVAAARRLQARSGWGQWPACSRNLGLR